MGIIISEVLDLDNLEFTEEEVEAGIEILLKKDTEEDDQVNA